MPASATLSATTAANLGDGQLMSSRASRTAAIIDAAIRQEKRRRIAA
jgi:hypothetical protein